MSTPVLVNEASKVLVSYSEASWCGMAFTYVEHGCLKLFRPPKQHGDAGWVMEMVPGP